MSSVRETMYGVERVGISHSSSSRKGDGNSDAGLCGKGAAVVEVPVVDGFVAGWVASDSGEGLECFLSLVTCGSDVSEVMVVLLLH
jgi:hypothetical protein